MLFRRLGVVTAVVAALSVSAAGASAAGASAAPGRVPSAALVVAGTVSDPASYTLSQLAALPSETVKLSLPGHLGSVQATGVSLDSLVTLASPVLPAAKNALLRVIVTASGPGGQRVSFALGELDPNFGDHDGVVVLRVNGKPLAAPALAVPGDKAPLRDLLGSEQDHRRGNQPAGDRPAVGRRRGHPGREAAGRAVGRAAGAASRSGRSP